MARNPMPAQVGREYLVIDDRIRTPALGGQRVTTRDGKRYVTMTPAQAQYWLDAGTIGVGEVGDKVAHDQVIGRREEPKEEAAADAGDATADAPAPTPAPASRRRDRE